MHSFRRGLSRRKSARITRSLFGAGIERLEDRRLLAQYLVTSESLGPDTLNGTLLYAIKQANANLTGIPDEIKFSSNLSIAIPGEDLQGGYRDGIPALTGPTKITGQNSTLYVIGTNPPSYGLRFNNTVQSGPSTISGLTISGFDTAGIYIERLMADSPMTISGNTITMADGHGIMLDTGVSNCSITGNTIETKAGTLSGWDGVAVRHLAGVGNYISDNKFIMKNGGTPIDLGVGGPLDGPTMNDVGRDDADTGPNNLLNFPENIQFALNGSNWNVSGTLDLPTALANQYAFVELYKYNVSTDEYLRIATTATITLGANGNASWSVTVPNGTGANQIQTGSVVAALAVHDADGDLLRIAGDTSEISPRSTVSAPAADLEIRPETDKFRGISGNLNVQYVINGTAGQVIPLFNIGIYRVNALTGAEELMFSHPVSDVAFRTVQTAQHSLSIPVPTQFDTKNVLEDYYLRAKLDDLKSYAEPNEENNVAMYDGGVFSSPAAIHAMGSARVVGDETFTISKSGGTITATMSGLEGFGYSGPALPIYVRAGTGMDIIRSIAVDDLMSVWGGAGNDTYELDTVGTTKIYEALDGDTDTLKLGADMTELFVDGQRLLKANSAAAADLLLSGNVGIPPTIERRAATTNPGNLTISGFAETGFQIPDGTIFRNTSGFTWFSANSASSGVPRLNVEVDRDEVICNVDQQLRFVTEGANGGQLRVTGAGTVVSVDTLVGGISPNLEISTFSGSGVVHDYDGTDRSVSVTVGAGTTTTVSGTATGVVELVHDLSGPIPTLRKYGSGTFRLTGITSKTVAVNFVNEEGKTEFHTNMGDPALGNGVNWNVSVHEMPGWAASTIEFHATQNLKSLDIGTGTEATVIQNGSRALVVDSLNIVSGGTLDMRDNDLVVHSTAATREDVFAYLYSLIVSAFNGGTWTGTGLTSTVARDNMNYDTALGIAKNADLGKTTFTGQTVNTDSILVKYTYYGDCDLDGDVDADDETLLANGYGSTNAYWVDGDVDYNNNVNADDLTVFANNFGKSGL